MVEKQRRALSRGGGTCCVFTEFIYLSKGFSFLSFFYFVFCDCFFLFVS